MPLPPSPNSFDDQYQKPSLPKKHNPAGQNNKRKLRFSLAGFSRSIFSIWALFFVGLLPAILFIITDHTWKDGFQIGYPVLHLVEARVNFAKAYQKLGAPGGQSIINPIPFAELKHFCRLAQNNLAKAAAGHGKKGGVPHPALLDPEMKRMISQMGLAVKDFSQTAAVYRRNLLQEKDTTLLAGKLYSIYMRFESAAMAATDWTKKAITNYSQRQNQLFAATLLSWFIIWLCLCLWLNLLRIRRKKAEADLRSTRELFAKAFEMSPFWVMLNSIDQGRFVDVNESFLKSTGYKRSEVIGKTSLELDVWVYESDRTLILEALSQKGSACGKEALCKTKSGETLTVIFFTQTITLKKKPHLITIALDVTEQKRLEAQLQQSGKMEALGTLASGIAHDFNNILQGMSSNIQVARANENPDGSLEELFEEMDQAVSRAADLVRRILAFSRKLKPHLRRLDLNQEITATVKILSRVIPKMINIEMYLSPDLYQVQGDPSLLQQVLMNLGANARDAMPKGGTLSFTTRNQKTPPETSKPIPGLVPGQKVVLEVRDTGQGMDQKTLKRIFEPFFSTKSLDRGTGLGLSSAYGIIQDHNGVITCQSYSGQGALFTIYLPACQNGQAQKQTCPTRSHLKQDLKANILLVDDEPVIRKAGAEFLKNAGIGVKTAASGEQAVRIYRQDKEAVDLIVLDLGMPGMGGFRCLEEILRFNPNAQILVASGYSDAVSQKKVKKAGAKAFLAKPYRLPDLLDKAKEILCLPEPDFPPHHAPQKPRETKNENT